MVKQVVGTPEMFTPNVMLPPDVLFLICVVVPETLSLKSWSAPTAKPVSFNTAKVPLVVSFSSLRKNCVESKLSSNCESRAVPWNNQVPLAVDMLRPGLT